MSLGWQTRKATDGLAWLYLRYEHLYGRTSLGVFMTLNLPNLCVTVKAGLSYIP